MILESESGSNPHQLIRNCLSFDWRHAILCDYASQVWSYATLLEALVVCYSPMITYSVFGQKSFKEECIIIIIIIIIMIVALFRYS
jgi:hypothetical protein